MGISFIEVLAVAAMLLYFYAKWSKAYFASKGVKARPYSVPGIGHMAKGLARTQHLKDYIYDTYNAFPDQKYVGHMQFTQPYIMIRDLDLLKQVTVKDFDHFLNHFGGFTEDVDPLFGRNLFSMRGEKWREMRSMLSPAFTSSKMKNMFHFIEEIGREMTEYFVHEMEQPEYKERGLVETEMKDAFSRYANDVIASTAFGFKINSFKEPNNRFFVKGKEAANFSGRLLMRFLLIVTMPIMAKLFDLKIFSQDTIDYFRNLVLGTMADRERNHIVRHDMIQLLMEAKKGTLKHEGDGAEEAGDSGFATTEESHVGRQAHKRQWTDDELVAQAVVFFIAGFETSSILMCFVAHELAINPEIQRKLQDEIDEVVRDKNGAKVEYSDLAKMKYMDMVVTETLRKWPPAVVSDRACSKPYTLPPPSEDSDKSYELTVGHPIWIPIYAIHRDPQYYPDPEKFDPERFSDENKKNLNQFAFMPFGLGPRNCIGSRFALMETKSIIFHLLAKFDLVETAKTQNPIKMSNNSFNLLAEKGFWVGLKPRM